MLTIRPEQLDAFQPQAKAAFINQLVDYLRREHADSTVQLPDRMSTVEEIPDETILEMVRNGIARARKYGISWESSIGAFVVLMFVTAPNFDEHPLIHRTLTDDSVEPNSRVDRMWERTTEENWEAVEQNYDANAWKLKPQEV